MNLKDLNYIYANLSKTNDFARSLCDQYRSKRSLSDKQWMWVSKLANDHRTQEDPKPNTRVVKIVALLRCALDAGMKRPKIVFNGLRVTAFSSRSKYAGDFKVMFNSVYAGRIDPQGNAFIYQGEIEDCVDVLDEFNSDPVAKAVHNGRLTGTCCFCGQPLTTKESVGMGYGPICADRYGLPWGSVEEYERMS